MTGKKFAKRAAALALAVSLLFSTQIYSPVSASSLGSLQKKQSELKKKQAAVAQELGKLRSDKSKKVEYKNALTEQIKTVQDQIDTYNDRIAELNQNITEKENRISGKQKDIDSNFTKLKGRLRALYMTGEASNIEIVLNAKSVMDLEDKTVAVKSITDHDTRLIDSLKTEMAEVERQKSEIEQSKKEASSAKTELDAKQGELTSYVNEANKVISEISANEQTTKAEGDKLAAERKKADAAVDQWYKDYYASLKKNNGGSSGGSGGYVSKGNFMWPVPSCTNITSGYGGRNIGYGGEFHKGIDISRGGIYGAPIVAADSGRVIQAGYGNYGTGYGGYGYVVAIDHGGGYSTLYGHMSSVAVSKGQQVTKGQTIGYVGSSGQATGAHLHFEIRVNGSAQNPMNWFSR